MPVSRCVCHDVPFATLIKLAEIDGLSLQQMADATGATTGCGTCTPYIRLALATRCPSLPVMSPAEIEAKLEQATAAPHKTPDKTSTTHPPPRRTFNYDPDNR